MTKLQIVHAAARALSAEETRDHTWAALLHWIGNADLESEILEALPIVLLAKSHRACPSDQLRRAINWPSILSDWLVSQAYDAPTLVNSWAKSHSGEAPSLFRDPKIERELEQAHIVPPILRARLTALEESSEKPFFKQWCYEFDRIVSRIGSETATTGDVFYFHGDDREHEAGQFVTRRGHVARSAYLRTLALAFDRWEMPEEIASAEAMYACPVDLAFLRMLPATEPKFAIALRNLQPRDAAQLQTDLAAVVDALLTQEQTHLLYLDAPLSWSRRYKADAEVITCLVNDRSVEPEKLFRFHHALPGRFHITRLNDNRFAVLTKPAQTTVSLRGGNAITAALLPAPAHAVGYFHSDLLSRMPYIPANYSDTMALIGEPCYGGVTLSHGAKEVGALHYWNWNWSPMHTISLGAPCGVGVCLAAAGIAEMLQVPDMHLVRACRATVLSRSSDYGDWEKQIIYGELPISSET